MLKRTSLLILIIWGLMLSAASASGGYNYISAEALKKRMDSDASIMIIDICPAEQFAGGHINGSIETNAYPVKTEEEKTRLAKYLHEIKASSDDVVIVCPRGGGGAKRTFDYYNTSGINKSRLLILEKGMNAWPYETEKKVAK